MSPGSIVAAPTPFLEIFVDVIGIRNPGKQQFSGKSHFSECFFFWVEATSNVCNGWNVNWITLLFLCLWKLNWRPGPDLIKKFFGINLRYAKIWKLLLA